MQVFSAIELYFSASQTEQISMPRPWYTYIRIGGNWNENKFYIRDRNGESLGDS